MSYPIAFVVRHSMVCFLTKDSTLEGTTMSGLLAGVSNLIDGEITCFL
jgi:hypothetical protein